MSNTKIIISSKKCYSNNYTGSLSPKDKSAIQKSSHFKSANHISPKSFSQNYSIISEIGKGSFGIIYKVFPRDNPSKIYAAKIVQLSTIDKDHSDLEKEAQILYSLSSEEGFSKIEDFHKESDKEVLIMSLLGPNLKTLQRRCGGKFSIKTVSLLALQILRRIEAFHVRGLLHRDLKPENLAMGSNENDEGTAYLIDFGLSEPFLDSQGQHVPFDKHKRRVGTVYFLSVFGHMGIQPTRRDDLISLGYILVYFLKGKLPWEQVTGDMHEKVHQMFKIKSTMMNDVLCSGLPSEFSEYFSYVSSLLFHQTPDYEFIQGLFKKVLNDLGTTEDGLFDWVEKKTFDLKGPKINTEGLDRYIKDREESEIEWDF